MSVQGRGGVAGEEELDQGETLIHRLSRDPDRRQGPKEPEVLALAGAGPGWRRVSPASSRSDCPNLPRLPHHAAGLASLLIGSAGEEPVRDPREPAA